MSTLAGRLASWVAGLAAEDLPDEVVASVCERVLDTLGICVAATRADAAIAARAVAAEWGGSGSAHIVGETGGWPAATAALVNGTYAHSLDFDDTHLPSVVHPSAPMVPALLAQAEALDSSGRAFVTAMAAAYEVNARLSMAQYDAEAGDSVMFERGLHTTSIVGALAGAAGCARLRSADPAGIANAIAIAASMGAGLIEANRAGGSVKKFHGGWAAHCAIIAASLAARGLTGPPTVLEGRFGFFQAFCGERWRPEEVTSELGSRWETPGIFFKPYPCNHFTHTVADAAFGLRASGVAAADVVHAVIGTARATWRTIGDPIEEKRRPRSGYHGAFSAPWVFACAMTTGTRGPAGPSLVPADFGDEHLDEPERKRLAGACDVVVDDECDRVYPHQFPGVVTVRLRDGRELTERVMTNLGGPARPMSAEQLRAKLAANAGERAAAIARACERLPDLERVADVLTATVTPG